MKGEQYEKVSGWLSPPCNVQLVIIFVLHLYSSPPSFVAMMKTFQMIYQHQQPLMSWEVS